MGEKHTQKTIYGQWTIDCWKIISIFERDVRARQTLKYTTLHHSRPHTDEIFNISFFQHYRNAYIFKCCLFFALFRQLQSVIDKCNASAHIQRCDIVIWMQLIGSEHYRSLISILQQSSHIHNAHKTNKMGQQFWKWKHKKQKITNDQCDTSTPKSHKEKQQIVTHPYEMKLNN